MATLGTKINYVPNYATLKLSLSIPKNELYLILLDICFYQWFDNHEYLAKLDIERGVFTL